MSFTERHILPILLIILMTWVSPGVLCVHHRHLCSEEAALVQVEELSLIENQPLAENLPVEHSHNHCHSHRITLPFDLTQGFQWLSIGLLLVGTLLFLSVFEHIFHFSSSLSQGISPITVAKQGRYFLTHFSLLQI